MAGAISFPHTILDRAFSYVKLEICMDEDWNEPFYVTEGERPIDLTGKRLEMICRPTFDHATLIRKLSTATVGAVPAAIFIDRPTLGAASICMPQTTVAAAFVPGRWTHFLRLLDDDVSSVPLVREVWRGDLIVLPGRV